MSNDTNREIFYQRAAALRSRWSTEDDLEKSSKPFADVKDLMDSNESELQNIKNECKRLNDDIKKLQVETVRVQEQIVRSEHINKGKKRRPHNVRHSGSVEKKPTVTNVASSARDSFEQRLRVQDVLAKISPRYMLQYKIDLALQKIYQDDMDEQAQSTEACTGLDLQEQNELSHSSSDDDSGSHASPTPRQKRVSSTSSSSSVTSSSSDECSPAPQAEKRSFTPDDNFSCDQNQQDTDIHIGTDVTSTTSPPVPKPRKRKASRELERSDEHVYQEQSNADELAPMSDETESSKVEDMTSNDTEPRDASLPVDETPKNPPVEVEKESVEFEERPSIESGEEGNEGAQINNKGDDDQTLETTDELLHPVASGLCKQDAEFDQAELEEGGNLGVDVIDTAQPLQETKEDVSDDALSESGGSSMDELDATKTQYVYQVNSVNAEQASVECSSQSSRAESDSSSDSDSVAPQLDLSAEKVLEDKQSKGSWHDNENTAPTIIVSGPVEIEAQDDEEGMYRTPDVAEEISNKATDFDERDSSSSSGESSAGDEEPGQVSIDTDTTPALDEGSRCFESIVSNANHAELFAPALARAVVIDGINEAAMVEVAPTTTTAGKGDGSDRGLLMTEQGYDSSTGDEEMQREAVEILDESQNVIESDAGNQETAVAETPLTNSTQDIALQDRKSSSDSSSNSNSSSSESVSSSDEEETYFQKEPEVEIYREATGEALAVAVETEKQTPEEQDPGVGSEEYVEVFQEEKKEDSVEGDEMRIIEHTGLINRDEEPEDKTKSSYNAAHSQRNTDATKWFGEPKPKDKVWLKPKGKVDDDAEAERRKVIKSMTRKHNPNMVQKWKPPAEKDWTNDLDGNKKESLRKYEERRKQRIESESDPTSRLRAASVESFADSQASEQSSSSNLEQQQQQQQVVKQQESEAEPKVVGNSEIIFEPVVHSRDAINVWESRLSEKFQKEKTEEKRLSVGKQRRTLWEAKRRERTESTSSVTSSTSSMSELPQSENIIRESIGVSDVRNREFESDIQTRWKNLDHSSTQKPPEVSPKPASRRSQSFTVKSASPYRSFGRVTSAKESPIPAVNSGDVTVISRRPGESQIDYEIRESAEREEKWRKENRHPESRESTSNPRSPEPEKNMETVNPVTETAEQQVEAPANNKNKTEAKSPVEEPPVTPVKVRSQTMPILDLSFALGPTPGNDVGDKHATVDVDTGADSGIECNATSAVTRSDVTSPLSEDGHYPSSSTAPHSGHEDDYASSELSATSQDDSHGSKENSPEVKSPQSSTLPTVMSPKGWSPKPTAISPVSPLPTTEKSFATVSNGHPASPPPTENGIKEELVEEEEEKKDVVPELNTTQLDSVDPSLAGANKTTMVVTRQRSGPSFEILSSKSRLQTIMELEIKEAAKREAEWKKHVVENRTPENNSKPTSPTPSSPPPKESPKPPSSPKESPKPVPPVVYRKPVKVVSNGDTKENTTNDRKVEENDDATKKIVTASSSEYKKKSVVMANRVHRRKSNLAMQWEAGRYKNHEEE